MGGSYGGYLTTFLIGRTTRFAAAISERAFLDPVSFVGSSDIGWSFPDQYLGTDPDAAGRAERHDPRPAITTPTLVIHSEEDWRCPLEQGARLYVELKRRGVPVGAAAVPGGGARAVPVRPAAAPARAAGARPALVGALAADAAEPGVGRRRAAGRRRRPRTNRAVEPRTSEPLAVRATRVD